MVLGSYKAGCYPNFLPRNFIINPNSILSHRYSLISLLQPIRDTFLLILGNALEMLERGYNRLMRPN